MEVLGPEHEYSVVNNELQAQPIVDKIIKDFYGRIVNFVEQPHFTFGKELQLHVMEMKPNHPFRSPNVFEETMQEAVLTMQDFLLQKYKANLLGTGMHPLLKLEETRVWPHRHRQIYEAYSEIFNLKQHGWLNIQSFQLNLPYADEKDGVLLHNILANLCAYLPAISASSAVYEDKLGENIDNRLLFYKENQREVPSITGDIIPEYTSSFKRYKECVIDKYSLDLANIGASHHLVGKEWINSRGVIFRFDRRAVEIRVMDEQECVKSDVALGCFIRATLRGLIEDQVELLPHEKLVEDFQAVLRDGLEATVGHPCGRTARQVCQWLQQIAVKNASAEEKKYLPLVQKRLEHGSLSEVIRERIQRKTQKTDSKEAILSVYSKLIRSLTDNEPYF